VKGHATPRRVFRLVASAALLAVSVLPSVASVPGAWAVTGLTAENSVPRAAGAIATASVTDLATVTLTSITPNTSVPKAPVTISGSVHNAGSLSIASPEVRAFIGDRPLLSRDAVSRWADTTGGQLAAEVARAPLGADLAPGADASFTLTAPDTAIPHGDAFAVLPLLVDVFGSTSVATSQGVELGGLHTFLPVLSAVKAYEPFSIAWLVPLTLDPDPALHGMDSAARTAAWTTAIGPGSRLDRVITGTDSSLVTWVIDPAILGPPTASTPENTSTAPGPTTTAPPAPDQGGAQSPDQVAAATTALANRLREAAPRHTLWSLPYADPDVTALLPLPSGVSALQALIRHTPSLDATAGPARSDIAWPVAGTLTPVREKQLKQAFSPRGLTGVITSASNLTANSGHTPDASRRSSDGLPLLAYDEALSRTFTQTSSSTTGAITIQRFLADTMALLGERPGTPSRSVLVAAPRTFAGDPTVLSSFFAAIAKAPWLIPTTTDQLLAASKVAAEEPQALLKPVAPVSPTPSPTRGDPLSPGSSPLTTARLGTISKTISTITGIASIRDDAEPLRTRWADAQNQILSARWRGHGQGIEAIDTATQAAVRAVSQGVRVAPSSVNFFADKGVLQITVVNDLAVPVHDVRLTLTPGQPRLRIEQQPGPLRIGAKSRTNVQLHITAIAAGLVPIMAVLTTPNGTPLGQNARVDVRVQPTSTWIYWVLGAVAGIILVLGTYRSLRRGSTRAARPVAQEIPLDV
jgi:hypothetical protein